MYQANCAAPIILVILIILHLIRTATDHFFHTLQYFFISQTCVDITHKFSQSQQVLWQQKVNLEEMMKFLEHEGWRSKMWYLPHNSCCQCPVSCPCAGQQLLLLIHKTPTGPASNTASQTNSKISFKIDSKHYLNFMEIMGEKGNLPLPRSSKDA